MVSGSWLSSGIQDKHFKFCSTLRLIKDMRQNGGKGGLVRGRVRGGEKHEIYAAAFGGHLFYD